MNHFRYCVLVLLVLLSSALLCFGQQKNSLPKEVEGMVTEFEDADTFTIQRRDRKGIFYDTAIRFVVVDAPEKDQSHHAECTDELASRIGMQWVRVIVVSKSYKRLVGRVLLNGEDINKAMLRAGCGWIEPDYLKHLTKQQIIDYVRAEATARDVKERLWSNPDAIRPSRWRELKKSAAKVRRD